MTSWRTRARRHRQDFCTIFLELVYFPSLCDDFVFHFLYFQFLRPPSLLWYLALSPQEELHAKMGAMKGEHDRLLRQQEVLQAELQLALNNYQPKANIETGKRDAIMNHSSCPNGGFLDAWFE